MAKEARKKIKTVDVLPFDKKNLTVFGIGLIVLVIGYILMAQPPVNGFLSRTLSPIILMIAYIFIIPYSIFYGRRKKEQAGESKQ